ncbi:MAG: hypothetical protein HN742_35615 [Lentisphaerae bacterium]|jgi:hypothetical protein|nr:hypothetical protein [Lentisphaerota bacterium]MBT4814376.1 hypothetical protein [Lentisphaerota bacterium]MBT5605625.1 hypothetical protein [Lentisphaerota bacterium]MBT7059022.1 hypothetical protein [Lentisphaerota bacterium]MBT7847253.1 hypothetical protein [Lentisphaerota bacterium]
MTHFRHSGQITVAGILMGLALGSLAALLLSIPYAYITVYVPFVFLNIIATAALGGLTGLCAAKAARKGDLQSPAAYVTIGLVVGVAAEFWNWVFWIFAISRQELLTFQPSVIVAVARNILPEGTWGMSSGTNITGIPLLCVWVVEGAIIIIACAAAALEGLKSYLCCPKCTTWFNTATKTLTYDVPAALPDVVDEFSRLQFACLADLQPVEAAGADRYLQLDLFFCPECSEFGCFSFTSVEMVKKKDKTEKKEDALIDKQLLPMEQLSELLGPGAPTRPVDSDQAT